MATAGCRTISPWVRWGRSCGGLRHTQARLGRRSAAPPCPGLQRVLARHRSQLGRGLRRRVGAAHLVLAARAGGRPPSSVLALACVRPRVARWQKGSLGGRGLRVSARVRLQRTAVARVVCHHQRLAAAAAGLPTSRERQRKRGAISGLDAAQVRLSHAQMYHARFKRL